MPADLSRADPEPIREEHYEGFTIARLPGDIFEISEGSTVLAEFYSWDQCYRYIDDNLLPVETVSAALSRPSKRDIGYLADVAKGRAA